MIAFHFIVAKISVIINIFFFTKRFILHDLIIHSLFRTQLTFFRRKINMSKFINYDEKCNKYDSERHAAGADVIIGLMMTHCKKEKKVQKFELAS